VFALEHVDYTPRCVSSQRRKEQIRIRTSV
jgi:hypothetical protein